MEDASAVVPQNVKDRIDIPDPNSEKQPESRTVIHVLVKPCPVRMSWGSLMLCMMMLRSAVKKAAAAAVVGKAQAW